MNFTNAISGFVTLHQQYAPILDGWLLIFSRLLAFTHLAPVFNRKDMPFQFKLGFAVLLTSILVWVSPLDNAHARGSGDSLWIFFWQIVSNVTVGGVIGYIGYLLMAAISAAGSTMSSQIGLSSAMMFDPASRTQTALLDPLFSLMATVLYIHMGGVEWMLKAFQRSLTVFPLHTVIHDWPRLIDIHYIITLAGNTLVLGVQFVAPVFLTAMVVDIMLGIVNKAAQQIPVFQLSYSIKPVIGFAALWLTLPQLLDLFEKYLRDHARLF
jgi:flagellar biosynthesis protein FliR